MTTLPSDLAKWRDRAETADVMATELKAENKRLQRVIAKELSENDELGCEYTYVNTLRARVKALEAALEFYAQEKHVQTYWLDAGHGLKPTSKVPVDFGEVAREALGKDVMETPAKDNNRKGDGT